MFSLILAGQAMAGETCYNLFKTSTEDELSLVLKSAGVEHTDMVDFIIVKPTGPARLNQLALWAEGTLGQKLVLLTHVGYSVDRELEEDEDTLIVYWPKLLLLLSQKVELDELKISLWNDFQTRRARQKQFGRVLVH